MSTNTRPPLTPAALAKLRGGVDYDALAEAAAPRCHFGDSLETHASRCRYEGVVHAFIAWVCFGNGPQDLTDIDASRIPQRVLGAALALDRRLLRGLTHEQVAALPRSGSVSSRRLRQLSDEFAERVLNGANLRPDASKPAP